MISGASGDFTSACLVAAILLAAISPRCLLSMSGMGLGVALPLVCSAHWALRKMDVVKTVFAPLTFSPCTSLTRCLLRCDDETCLETSRSLCYAGSSMLVYWRLGQAHPCEGGIPRVRVERKFHLFVIS